MATALVLFVGLLLAPTTAPAVAGKGASSATKYGNAAHKATNSIRAKHDAVELGMDGCLRQQALEQANAMATSGDLSHQSMSAVAAKCKMGYVGENVAYGFRNGRSVVKGWMKSPGHRENLLSPNFRVMGIGAVKRDGVWWVAQVFGRRP